ncbi:quinoprotein dehydrogenase-associated SoxYZ-like carrier [Notoacmeibacter sp. MSK16QG-6]|uniref:quinoprotein dehydrogenase-associated SoxYZ-like carrier n=1 Tax=Notoacmeibacter sp. MSK16QG-6 TaxID=2957982 RepID=UPI00209EA024|nr:quinoprotein dehydrogenase-associated SoxYZ-like carrier [Notoacmeibacter sp. MSK16QG-6]MCP1200651.1 quinoprotein dehydrogenase-associated SoxYZ-like carrier [Notoacmeibacter sp. MSK16QG-6]
MRIIMALIALSAGMAALASSAETTSWDDIRTSLYGDRILQPAADLIVLDAPYRSAEDARTVVGARLQAPQGDALTKVILVIDENPMPVSAVFELSEPQDNFRFETTMRLNGPSNIHVIAETVAGETLVTEQFVKTSGQGACSAPPGTDPELALATLGDMTIGIVGRNNGVSSGQWLADLANRQLQMKVDIRHPSHSGMQMDQISMLFIPMRYVETVRIDLDGRSYIGVTGSISLSENPQITLSIPAATARVDVTMTDTDGTITQASRSLAEY